MGRGFAWGVLAALALASVAGAWALVPSGPPPGPMLLWEAYDRGYVTITQVDLTYDRGGFTVTLPVGYRLAVSASAPSSVVVDEPAMLMSPSPAQFAVDPSAPTTQDGAITPATIPPGGALTYSYADEAVQGFLPNPVWWCTERYQYTHAGVQIVLGGEILPDALQGMIQHPYHDSDSANTQEDVWAHLATYPTVVVGKLPFWKEIPTTAGQIIPVTVTATNIAVKTDALSSDTDAHGVVVRDTIPSGWSVVSGSYSTAPTNTIDNPDGSKTVEWVVDIPAANVADKSDLSTPTPYHGQKFRYQLESPHLTPGRLEMPRAEVDTDADGTVDAHSDVPVVDVFRLNNAPTAALGGPYTGVEGTPITFDASTSSDPDGDHLQFRWDFDSDGTWDTDWQDSAVSPPLTFGDDASGSVTVEVSDSELTATATAAYLIANAPPHIDSIVVDGGFEGAPTSYTVTFSDPGWLDTHTAFVDWGTGEMESLTLESSHDPPAATGTFTITHTYGDDFAYPGALVLMDDDGGVGGGGMTFSIANVAPALLEVHAMATAAFGIRVAGEKWHDVSLTLSQNGEVAGTAGVVRMPGSPDNQTAWSGDVTIDLTGDFQATLVYTPEDDPVNGQPNGDNPVWLLVRFDDGSEGRIQHNFNVQHPDTWTWSVGDLLPLFVGKDITLSARASDAGSDDLSFTWDFGDGSSATTLAYNNGASADFRPSPDGTFPFDAGCAQHHVYAAGGGHAILLTIRDDDGGETTVLLSLGL